MKKFKGFFIVAVLCVFAFGLWQSTGCSQFRSFYFDKRSIKIAVEGNVNTDIGVDRNVSRVFHNKLTTGVFEVSKSYMYTIEPSLLVQIAGPLGLVLLVAAISRITKEKKMIGYFHILLVFGATLFLILNPNPKNSFYIISVAWYSLAIRGIDFFIERKTRVMIFGFLFLLTLAYFTFSWQLSSVCTNIFFN